MRLNVPLLSSNFELTYSFCNQCFHRLLLNSRRLGILLNILLLLLATGCVHENSDNLKVVLGREYTYQCDDGSKIKARFCSLSDSSLNFVKIITEDGKEYTLPQLVSGSGARYSDERGLEFWIKGNEVTISKMGEDGKWKIVKHGRTKN